MRTILALALAFAFACHAHPPVLTAPDGTPYVDQCPEGLEDVACYEAVVGS